MIKRASTGQERYSIALERHGISAGLTYSSWARVLLDAQSGNRFHDIQRLCCYSAESYGCTRPKSGARPVIRGLDVPHVGLGCYLASADYYENEAAYYNKNGESDVMNNNAEQQVVALELCRFLAHCIAAIVVVGMLFVALVGSWHAALSVGVVPLLAIMACDYLARRKETAVLTADA